MAALALDAGALIALERLDRDVANLLATAAESDLEVTTSSACVAQVWRNPTRQVRLARALAGIVEQPFDSELARRCGVLLESTGTTDIVDAAVALLAHDEDILLTSDPQDIARLLAAAGTKARICHV